MPHQCTVSGCNNEATYSTHLDGKPSFCTQHKRSSMFKICEFGECTREASYSDYSEDEPRYCTQHKQPQMVKISKRNKGGECCFVICIMLLIVVLVILI